MKWPILGGLCALTLPNIVRLCRHFYQSQYLKREKQCLQNLWKIWIFTEAGDTQILHIWSNFEPKLPPEDGQNPEKQNNSRQKFSDRAIQICYQHQPRSSFPFQWKIGLHFALFESFFVKIRAWSKVIGSESKSNLAYAGATISGVLNMQTVLSHQLLVLRILESKDVF